MAGFTHKVGVNFSTDAGTITSTVDTYAVDSEVNIDETVAISQTDKEYDLACKHTQIKTLCIYSDQDLTLKFNSTSSPAPLIALVAKKQIVWTVDHLEANPITADLTKVYVTNASGTKTANLKIRIGLDVGV
jgi:hypothetical protein